MTRTRDHHEEGERTDDMLKFAKAYASLGDAVASQVDDLLLGRFDEVAAGAVELIRERLGGMIPELDEAICTYDERNPNLVDREYACPHCGERDQDRLVWQGDRDVRCARCDQLYRLP